MDKTMTKQVNKQKPTKSKPLAALSPDLLELLHMISALEKQPMSAKG